MGSGRTLNLATAARDVLPVKKGNGSDVRRPVVTFSSMGEITVRLTADRVCAMMVPPTGIEPVSQP